MSNEVFKASLQDPWICSKGYLRDLWRTSREFLKYLARMDTGSMRISGMIQGSPEVTSEGSPGHVSKSFQRSLKDLSRLPVGLSLDDSSFRDPGEVALEIPLRSLRDSP